MKEINALVTGGATGLGKIISSHLSMRGAAIYVLDRISPDLIDKEFAGQIHNYIQIDLNEIMYLNTLADIFPQKKINILINNASLREFGELNTFDDANIKRIIHVNFTIPILLTNYFLDFMLEENFGRIINISSKSGFWGYSSGSLYCSTKSALIKLTESLSKDLRKLNKDITANVICPDSFSDTTGKQLKNYNYVISSTLKALDRIINTNVNGKCYTSIGLVERIMNIFKYTRQQITG